MFYVFIVMFGFSWWCWVCFIIDECVEMLVVCYYVLFEVLGGVFCEIFYDNVKIIVVECDVYGDG